MSRIGKQPIVIPEGIDVKINKREVKIRGPKGELRFVVNRELNIEEKEGGVFVSPLLKSFKGIRGKHIKSLWGLNRTLIFNMVKGVSEGYEKQLQIEGVGYRAETKDKNLILNLGFSHPVEVKSVPGIEYAVEKNIITIKGIDKQQVGQIAAIIRSKRKPEPYKGKGISYVGEVIRRKAGKKAAGTE